VDHDVGRPRDRKRLRRLSAGERRCGPNRFRPAHTCSSIVSSVSAPCCRCRCSTHASTARTAHPRPAPWPSA
jgi:hypothetical protein